MAYVVRGLPRTYVEVARIVNRSTLGIIPLAGGFLVFWLVPGAPAFEAARALRRGQPAPVASRPRLAALWAFVAVVAVWVAWRRGQA